METHNIISTPAITGNVGDCTSRSITVETGRDLWIINQKNIVTNSCTGEITTYDTWEVSGVGYLGCFFVGVLLFFVIATIIAIVSPSNTRDFYNS